MGWNGRNTWVCCLVVLAAARARAEDYYVAPPPTGDDSHAGTQVAPFASFARAQTAANAGDTVYFRGGNYAVASATAADGVVLSKSGSAGKLIHYVAYPNEKPVFDFSGMTAAARITGLRVTGSYIHLKGLELKGVPQNIDSANESWGVYNIGGHNLYEQLDLHHNQGPGLFLHTGGNNLVLNCDSHDNYDPHSKSGDGSNADGFGAHVGTGDTGNVFRGCRSWWNSDDGFDFIQAQESVTVENSWAWYNGYLSGTMTAKGNGNGFKAGGYGEPPTNVPASPPVHVVRFCLAFSNRAAGFYANHHPVAGDWYNDTGYKNAPDFNMLGNSGDVGILRNNLAYAGTLLSNDTGIDDADNSWTLPVMVSDADFASVSIQGVDGPRGADGSLPVLPFMHLKAGSDLIDRGHDVGLPFVGSAPDLGAFEFGAVMPAADGGVPNDVDAGGTGASAAGTGSAGQATSGSAGSLAADGGSRSGAIPGLAGRSAMSDLDASVSAAGTGGARLSDAGVGQPSTVSGCSCQIEHGSDPARGIACIALALSAWFVRRRQRR